MSLVSKEILEALSSAFKTGYAEGHTAGYLSGYLSGYSSGVMIMVAGWVLHTLWTVWRESKKTKEEQSPLFQRRTGVRPSTFAGQQHLIPDMPMPGMKMILTNMDWAIDELASNTTSPDQAIDRISAATLYLKRAHDNASALADSYKTKPESKK